MLDPWESYLIITTGQLSFARLWCWTQKNDNLDMFLSCLTTFSMWAVVQQQHVLTSSVCVTVHIDMCSWRCEIWANHIFWQDKREAHWVFLFLSEMKTRCDGHLHRCFLPVCIAECMPCRRENELKRELLIGRNAPSCELDPTHVKYK